MNSGKFDFTYFDSLIKAGLKHAVFDLENTVVRSNVTHLYFFAMERRFRSRWRFLLWKYLEIALWGPVYLGLDFLNRNWFQRVFYRRFGSFSLDELSRYGQLHFQEELQFRFHPYVHDLIIYLKESGVDVSLLSTSTEVTVGVFGEYFGIPYHCLQLKQGRDGCEVDLSGLDGFKRNYIEGFDPASTLAVADSKHDLPVLEYVHTPVVVASRKQRWMRSLNGKIIRDNGLENL